MHPNIYIIAGIIIGLLFAEFTGISPGGVIVPGYLALYFNRPAELAMTLAASLLVFFLIKLLSPFFFLFGRRRYALCLLLGLFLKLLLELLYGFIFIGDQLLPSSILYIQLAGALIPGIIANDFYKQGLRKTLLASASASALVFILLRGAELVFT